LVERIVLAESRAALIEQFAQATSIKDRWHAASHLMASRALVTSIGDPQFEMGFKGLEQEAAEGDGIPRLLAIDLIVRVTSLAKKLKSRATLALSHALQRAAVLSCHGVRQPS
jgi:hypothetical protein